jgi:triacylglycerol esterase/lipase EstA (alpha/beta hydrolase family)
MWSAISLALLTVAGFAAYGHWALQAVARGHSAWGYVLGVPIAYCGVILAFTLVEFALSWCFRAKRPPSMRLSPAGIAALIWGEFRALAGAAPRMIFYRRLVADPLPAPARTPLLLVHGVLCNGGIWNRVRAYLAAHDVGPVYVVTLTPPLASIEQFAGQVAARIDAILAATGAAQVILVGHSMGGLVARAYLRGYGGAKVKRVITLGTPHHGSVVAWLFPGNSLAQIRPGNRWLEALPGALADFPPFTSIWSWHDSMVAPQTSARLEGAHNIELAGVGHNALLGERRVFEVLVAEIRKAGDWRVGVGE